MAPAHEADLENGFCGVGEEVRLRESQCSAAGPITALVVDRLRKTMITGLPRLPPAEPQVAVVMELTYRDSFSGEFVHLSKLFDARRAEFRRMLCDRGKSRACGRLAPRNSGSGDRPETTGSASA